MRTIWVAREINDDTDETTWEDYFETLAGAQSAVNARFVDGESEQEMDSLEWENVTTEIDNDKDEWFASSGRAYVYYVCEMEVKP